jgi:hypothetical protein
MSQSAYLYGLLALAAAVLTGKMLYAVAERQGLTQQAITQYGICEAYLAADYPGGPDQQKYMDCKLNAASSAGSCQADAQTTSDLASCQSALSRCQQSETVSPRSTSQRQSQPDNAEIARLQRELQAARSERDTWKHKYDNEVKFAHGRSADNAAKYTTCNNNLYVARREAERYKVEAQRYRQEAYTSDGQSWHTRWQKCNAWLGAVQKDPKICVTLSR